MPDNKKRPAGRTSSRPKPVSRSVKKPSTADKRTVPAPTAKPSSKPRIAAPVVAPIAPAAPSVPKRAPKPTRPPLSILMVASEAHPYAKTGGLAEVAAALPDALGRMGHRVTLVLPRYKGIDLSGSRSQATSISIGGRVQLVRHIQNLLRSPQLHHVAADGGCCTE